VHTRRPHRRCSPPPAVLLATLALLATLGAPTTGRARGRDWPQWRGPKRDGLSTERGLLRRWPQQGPPRLWTAEGLGTGLHTLAVADGRIYVPGTVGRHTVVTALGPDGSKLWQVENGPAAGGRLDGARGCPVVDGGWLFHLSPHGNLLCLEPKTKTKIWSTNVADRFKSRATPWGSGECILVDRGNLVCCPAGEQTGIVALNKKTGDIVWTCNEVTDPPPYSAPISFTFGGLRQIVVQTPSSIVGLHATSGKVLWRVEQRVGNTGNIPTPVYSRTGHLFVQGASGIGATLLKVLVKGTRSKVRDVWHAKAIDARLGSFVLYHDHFYGPTPDGKWVCLHLRTGRQMYAETGVGKGFVTCADGMLYTYSQTGTIALVKATPKSHQIISQFTVPTPGREPNWAPPVIAGGRLLLRYGDQLHCYNIAQQ